MKYKDLLLTMLLSIVLYSCNTAPQPESITWEYKTITDDGSSRSEYTARSFEDPADQLNKLGKEGWELVGVTIQTETQYPNFGDDKYVTGIRTNTRTAKITYILKRKKVIEPDENK